MQDRSSKEPKEYKANETGNRGKGVKPHDANIHAFDIVQQAIGEKPREHSTEKPEKNPAAVSLGRLGGMKGGKARAATLTAEQRSEIARTAAQARWKQS